MEITEYDFTNFTFDVALEYSRVMEDALKESPVLLSLLPEEVRFGLSHWPSVADFEQLQRKLDSFRRFVYKNARMTHHMVKSNPRLRVFLLKNEYGKLVACTLWILPDYVEVPQLSYYAHLRNFVRAIYYGIVDYIAYFGHTQPFGDGAFLRELDWARERLGVVCDPEREKELASMSREQRKQVAYPRSLTYYLSIMVVRTDEQRKGYGKLIIDESLKRLGPYSSYPPFKDGPIKATLSSAPTARGFYKSCGWEIGASVAHTLDNGVESIHTIYFKDID